VRKIRLDFEELVVESFVTADGREKTAGTVRGHGTNLTLRCNISDGSYCATCGYGGQVCPQDTVTCGASCLMTDGYAACREPNCTGA
jgi:hypothetical protein